MFYLLKDWFSIKIHKIIFFFITKWILSLIFVFVGASLPGLVGHYSTVYSVSFSARDTVLYSGGRDRFILQWDPPLQISAAQASKVSLEIFFDVEIVNFIFEGFFLLPTNKKHMKIIWDLGHQNLIFILVRRRREEK